MLAILRKELRTYFLTPTGWIFLTVFLLLSGLLFFLQNVRGQSSDYASVLSGLIFVFILVVPLLTMRVFADERRLQTDQLLLTGPTGLWSIVLGKFLGALSVLLVTLAVTVLYPVLLSFHGTLEWAKIVGTYFGFLLLGSSVIALGVYASSTTESLVGAALLTFCFILVALYIDVLDTAFVSQRAGLIWVSVLAALGVLYLYSSGKNWPVALAAAVVLALGIALVWLLARNAYAGLFGKSLGWISLSKRFESFPMGMLRLDAVVYYLSFTGFFLFLTVQGLEKRRWK